jgi:hypothetical protein
VFVIFLLGELEAVLSPHAARLFAKDTDVRFFAELCIAWSQILSD